MDVMYVTGDGFCLVAWRAYGVDLLPGWVCVGWFCGRTAILVHHAQPGECHHHHRDMGAKWSKSEFFKRCTLNTLKNTLEILRISSKSFERFLRGFRFFKRFFSGLVHELLKNFFKICVCEFVNSASSSAIWKRRHFVTLTEHITLSVTLLLSFFLSHPRSLISSLPPAISNFIFVSAPLPPWKIQSPLWRAGRPLTPPSEPGRSLIPPPPGPVWACFW